jgi:crotonobetainyl-CoA:carnitine CoA-transferase CaiB-like acyl-CoA transferase
MLLADLGAEVVKVERPGVGDETRSWGPPWSGGQATYFLAVNRNKTSRSLDLSNGEGRAAAHELVAGCDVVVQNFRAGTMEKLGLGYEQLVATRPDLVYCSVTGFGSAAGADLPGFDLVVQAVGGLMSITGTPDTPTKVGVALVDVVTGLHAALGILAALRHRDRTGEGQHVEGDLLSSLLSAMTNQSASYLATGRAPQPMGNQHPSIAPYEVLRTADRPLVVAAGNDRIFTRLAGCLGRPDLATDARFGSNAGRVARRDELVAELEAVLATAPAEQWFADLSAAGVPCGPINDLGEAFDLATRLGLEPVVEQPLEAGGWVRTVANPVRLSATPATYRRVPPSLEEPS